MVPILIKIISVPLMEILVTEISRIPIVVVVVVRTERVCPIAPSRVVISVILSYVSLLLPSLVISIGISARKKVYGHGIRRLRKCKF